MTERERREGAVSPERQRAVRSLAAVDEVLRDPTAEPLLQRHPRALVTEAVRAVIDRLRHEILSGGEAAAAAAASLAPQDLVPWVAELLEAAVTPSLRRVINAAGVVVHTNLGRAALPACALDALVTVASGYSNLEYSLGSGERASRQDHLREVLCSLTGAEDAHVVNNNAAAVLLALAAAASGGEVLVSRGQLVEIGDGFRIPDILRESGAELVEVGTTNRTYLRDYERAWTERTRAVLYVHTSNYRVVGFTAEPDPAQLAQLAHERGALLVADLGSGALANLPLFAEEPSLRSWVETGADLLTLSGDKLLGGPQAGIIIGRPDPLEAVRRHPLARAMRIDKLGVAALDATLRLYLNPPAALEQIPTLRALATPRAEVRKRAERLVGLLASSPGSADLLANRKVTIVKTAARAGAGALPTVEVPSAAVALACGAGEAQRLAAALRGGEPAVVCRLRESGLLLDLCAVADDELEELAAAVLAALT